MKLSPLILAGAGIVFATSVYAGLENISYPIAELGNCESQDACFAYCGEPTHYDACMAFAEANQILEEEEIQEYKEMQEIVAQGGPGGCTSQATCEAYCGDLNNMQECLAFAEEHGLMEVEELEEARKVQSALDAGYSMPGGCTSEATCETYCSQPGNMDECLSFAQAAGFMSEEEVEEARQVMTIMQSGNSPGGCQNQEECEAYCQDEANREECVAFAVEAGFMTQEEAEMMGTRDGETMEEFVGPGGCSDEQSCRTYCEQEQNREECGAFFGDDGGESEFLDEGERDDRASFAGPGGCVGEEACMTFCSLPENQETCASFFGAPTDDGQGQDDREQPLEPYDQQEPPEQLDQLWPDSEDEFDDGSVYLEPFLELYQGEEGRYEMMPETGGEEGTFEYEYEGSSGFEDYPQESFDDPGWEEFDPGDQSIPLLPSQEGSVQDGESSNDQGGQGAEQAPSGEQSLLPQTDAGFVESVRRFFENVLTRTKGRLSI